MTSRVTASSWTHRPALRLAALCAVAVVGLTACGGGGDDSAGQKGVDTLETGVPRAGAPDSKASVAAVDAKRPQMRLDTSKEEAQRLTDAYNGCLQAHGVPMNTRRAAAAGLKQAPPIQDPDHPEAHKAAYAACLVKLPLVPPEVSPDNPHYDDMMRAEVKCDNAGGDNVKILMGDDGHVSGWTYTSDSNGNLSAAARAALEAKCHKQGFHLPADAVQQ